MASLVYKPKLLDDTLRAERDGKYLFLVPSKPDWVVTNTNGAYALSLCDGTRSLTDIRQLISSVHPDPDEGVQFVQNLHADGFFDFASEQAFRIQRYELKSVHLNVTAKCNLHCTYCYAEERDNGVGDRLSIKDYERLIDELADISPNIRFSFTGGEPLLNKSASHLSRDI